jgi:hypothetical protein
MDQPPQDIFHAQRRQGESKSVFRDRKQLDVAVLPHEGYTGFMCSHNRNDFNTRFQPTDRAGDRVRSPLRGVHSLKFEADSPLPTRGLTYPPRRTLSTHRVVLRSWGCRMQQRVAPTAIAVDQRTVEGAGEIGRVPAFHSKSFFQTLCRGRAISPARPCRQARGDGQEKYP